MIGCGGGKRKRPGKSPFRAARKRFPGIKPEALRVAGLLLNVTGRFVLDGIDIEGGLILMVPDRF
jgi:hypothetical protein